MTTFYETVHTSETVYVREHSSVESAEQAVESAGSGIVSKVEERQYKASNNSDSAASYYKVVAMWEYFEGKWYGVDINHIGHPRIGEDRPSTSQYV